MPLFRNNFQKACEPFWTLGSQAMATGHSVLRVLRLFVCIMYMLFDNRSGFNISHFDHTKFYYDLLDNDSHKLIMHISRIASNGNEIGRCTKHDEACRCKGLKVLASFWKSFRILDTTRWAKHILWSLKRWVWACFVHAWRNSCTIGQGKLLNFER